MRTPIPTPAPTESERQRINGLVTENERLARSIAHKMSLKYARRIKINGRQCESIRAEVIQSAAYAGLLRAAERYDESKSKFSTFAYEYISGTITSKLRDFSNDSYNRNRVLTLESRDSHGEKFDDDRILGVRIDPDAHAMIEESTDSFEGMISILTPRQKDVVRLIVIEKMNSCEIASKFNCSEQNINQMYKSAIKKLFDFHKSKYPDLAQTKIPPKRLRNEGGDCKVGHSINEMYTYKTIGDKSYRRCRVCLRISIRRGFEKKREAESGGDSRRSGKPNGSNGRQEAGRRHDQHQDDPHEERGEMMASSKKVRSNSERQYIEAALRDGRARLMDIGVRHVDADVNYQARVKSLDMGHVRNLAERRDSGTILDPVVLFEVRDGVWKLVDGFHRFKEALVRKDDSIRAYVIQGSEHEAMMYATMCNQETLLPRSKEDRDKAVRMLLEDPVCGQWASRRIADHVGCSHIIVNRVRVLYHQETSTPFPENVILANGKTFPSRRSKTGQPGIYKGHPENGVGSLD